MSRKRYIGNSARSQMAEGLVNHYTQEQLEAFQVMAELGIDMSSQRSKSVAEFRDSSFDMGMTLCDDAAKTCSAWLGQGRVIHKGVPDPAQAVGDEAERLRAFQGVRDRLRELVLSELHDATQLPDMPLWATEGEKEALGQALQDLIFWAHVLESAHDDESRSVALAGYQFAVLQLAFDRL